MTLDQAVQIANAGKRVTTDFSAGGTLAKQVNQAVPFFNASVQGARTFARVFKEKPKVATARALAFVALGMGLWWKNKDEEWYHNLPWREKYLYWNFSPDGKNVVQIPKAIEWGNMSNLVEGAFDSWYRKDPDTAKSVLGHVFDTTNPIDMPVLARTAWEQALNKNTFFNRPIVPRNQVDLPPGEQFSDYNSELSKALGRAFPDSVSPRRVDAIIRSIFGGVVPDTIQAVESLMLKSGIPVDKQKVKEEADMPIIGRLFRRGGQYSGNSQPIADFYDQWTEWKSRAASKQNPLKGEDMAYWKTLNGTQKKIKTLQTMANIAKTSEDKQKLNKVAAEEAEKALKIPNPRDKK
jgi:hypothetical protein